MGGSKFPDGVIYGFGILCSGTNTTNNTTNNTNNTTTTTNNNTNTTNNRAGYGEAQFDEIGWN